MAILGINTAIKKPVVAIINGNASKEIELSVDQQQTENLIPTISKLLQEFDISPTDLTSIVVVKGPGSFTALRIGVVAANALAATLKIPLYAIDTFEYLKITSDSKSEFVLIHAGGDQVYINGNKIEELSDFLLNYKQQLVVADLSKEQFEKYSSKLNFADKNFGFVEVLNKVILNPEYLVSNLPLEPNYIKEANISKEHKK